MIPKTIQVGPLVMSVTQRELDSDDDAGVTVVDHQTIAVTTGLGPDRLAEVLLHECLHALWALSGIDGKINEEHVVTRLSPHLLDLLRRNPALMKFLL